MQNDLVEGITTLLSFTMEDIPDIEPLESSFPEVKKGDLFIENKMYKSPKLRKIHLEVANIGKLKILHCVFFPNPKYDIPIFGCDIVQNEKVITAAIVDVSPITGSEHVYEKLSTISNNFRFKEKRPLPLWGDEIFSPFCKFVRLTEDIEIANFYCVVLEYLGVFCESVRDAELDPDWIKEVRRMDDQIWYCTQQQKNDKTRGILENVFDKQWAENYIATVLFDKPTCKTQTGQHKSY